MYTQEEIQALTKILKNAFLAEIITYETLEKTFAFINPSTFVTKEEIVRTLHCSRNYPNWLYKTGKLKKIVLSKRKIGTSRESFQKYLEEMQKGSIKAKRES